MDAHAGGSRQPRVRQRRKDRLGYRSAVAGEPFAAPAHFDGFRRAHSLDQRIGPEHAIPLLLRLGLVRRRPVRRLALEPVRIEWWPYFFTASCSISRFAVSRS